MTNIEPTFQLNYLVSSQSCFKNKVCSLNNTQLYLNSKVVHIYEYLLTIHFNTHIYYSHKIFKKY